VIQDSSAPPEEYALIEELVNLDDPAELKTKLEMNKDKINEAFLEAVAALMSQAEEGEENQDFKTKLEELYNQALRMSMRQNMQ
jgi:hypothetical protein